jgi:hypothetical protein
MDRRDAVAEVEIRCFPDRDDGFRTDVQEAIARSRGTDHSGQSLLEVVRHDLKGRYPAVDIRERDRLAEVGEHSDHWYVYRDGRIA